MKHAHACARARATNLHRKNKIPYRNLYRTGRESIHAQFTFINKRSRTLPELKKRALLIVNALHIY